MSGRLQGISNIWITGASSGIGEAVTRTLARGGHRLILTGRRPEPLEAHRTLAPDRIASAPADTTSRDSLAAIAGSLEQFGTLNMAILNAGT